MKQTAVLFLMLASLFSVQGEEWKAGVNVGLNSLQATIGVEFLDSMSISFEAGSSWETKADMRMDDARFKTVLRYAPPLSSKLFPYIASGFQCLYINRGYTTFWTPGVEVGLGLQIPVGPRNEIFLEAGWQYAEKAIISRKIINSIEVLYEDEWRASPVYLSLGWRISLWERGE